MWLKSLEIDKSILLEKTVYFKGGDMITETMIQS